ncbi:MAG: choice-of-anchor I family protein [Luteolibacter sp.]
MKIKHLSLALLSASLIQAAYALNTGDIAFTGFNSDGNDNLAFVALVDIQIGEAITFEDNEWNGTGWVDTNENAFIWTATEIVTAGTVVALNNVGSATPSTSSGTIVFGASATYGSNRGIGNGDEMIYAYQGTRTSPTFITAVTNGTGGFTGSNGVLTSTGLTPGSNALDLNVLDEDGDIYAWIGTRTGYATWAAVRTALNATPTIGNWNFQDATGDQSADGTPPDAPFASTPFTIGAAPTATVSITAAASIAEGNSGSAPLTLSVTRTVDPTAFSVDYAVTGGTATSGTDFTPLVSGTLNFAVGGGLTQDIILDILGDSSIESNETIIVTLSNLVQTTGTTGLGNLSGTATITNDDTVPLTYPASGSLTSTVIGSIDLDASPLTGGAEIPAFDPISKRAFAASGVGIQVVNLANPAAPAFVTNIQPSTLGVLGLSSNDISSVSVRKGTGGNPSILAASIINNPKTTSGHVVLLNAATGALIGSAIVGVVPDHIAWTPDGTKLLVCNEGELSTPQTTVALAVPDAAQGTVSIVPVDAFGIPGTVQTANFSAFDAQTAALKAAGVRIFDDGVPSTDFEPEYLAISRDGTKAMVTLQEANAVAILDIASAAFTSVVPLGEKDFSLGKYDFSDQDGAGGTNLVKPTIGNPVFGLYMPDAIASYQVAGQTYYVTANEGDDRNDFLAPDETTTVSDASYNLDDTAFPTEITLKTPASLGRLVVSNLLGLRGDTDADTDIDRILSLGGRSFSILDSTGARVFDSGDMIETIVASQFPALFDDARSDNKGPEPEGVTVAKIGARTFAFVGLERSHMTLAFDVTNPLAPTYAAAFQRTGDTNPEGMVVIEAGESPTGKPLLLVANEVSNTLTVFEIGQPTDFKLQLLHLADAEAGLLASSTAPNLAALVDAFDGTFPNTLILAGGDNYIPGPFAAAGTDALVSATHTRGNNPFAADIEIHNRLGVEASTVGNHEFDFGTNAFSDAILDTNFPYLSSNLDFSGDTGISARYQETVGAGLEEATSVKNKVVPSCVVTKGTEKIGLVGVTTQIIESISSTGGVEVKGFTGDGLETNNMALLAIQVQPVINDLISQGVDKVVLMAHLQQITFEQQLAPLLTGVDIVLAAGSNTRLGDSNDVAVAFAGHDANFAGNYPIYTAGADGLPTVIVNTDNEFTYLGRLVADFDADGVLIVPNLLANTAVNGAYAATAANAAAAWGVAEVDLLTSAAFAPGSKGALVKQITDAVQGVITVKDGAIRGYTDVYLEGERNFVRNQETNLGDISADSMIAAGKIALPSATHVAALKNGGGIRAAIGSVDVLSGAKLPPLANPTASKPAGAVSLLDIENSMRFNNGLMLCDTTPAGLKAILEHGVANAGTGNGRFPQIGGIRFSYVPAATAGSRIQSIVLVDENDNITGRVVSGGLVRPDAPAIITLVTMNFLAGNAAGINTAGGDGYPFKVNADNFRFLLNDGTLSDPVGEELNYNDSAVVPANILREQPALSNYLLARYATPATAYDIAETVPALDTRIQSTAVRTDNVLAGPATFAAWLALNGFTSTGINADTDLDGATDLVEYFFNQSTNSGSDNGNLPVVTSASGEKFLTFTTNNTVAGVNGVLQTSTDLGVGDSWGTAVAGVDYEAVSSVTAGAETTVTVKLLGAAAKNFFRYCVTQD